MRPKRTWVSKGALPHTKCLSSLCSLPIQVRKPDEKLEKTSMIQINTHLTNIYPIDQYCSLFHNICKWTPPDTCCMSNQTAGPVKMPRTPSIYSENSLCNLEPSSSTIILFHSAGKRTDPAPFPISGESGLHIFGEKGSVETRMVILPYP